MKPPFQSYTGDEPFVFVCYSHADKKKVYPELLWLREQGFNIWYDEGIPPGDEWQDRIASAIQNADQFLFYLSPNSAQSRVCRDEFNLALYEKIRTITVQLKPADLVGGLKLSLGSTQAIVKDTFRTVDDYRLQLKATLQGSGVLPLRNVERKTGIPAFYGLIGIALLATLIFGTYQFARNNLAINENTELRQQSSTTSIAVLPLRDMSPAGNLEYLGDGLAEELIHALAQVPGINVVATTSSFYFKGQDLDIQFIGNKLGANTVLEGSVRKEGNQIRINLQLIDVSDGYHIWSQQYDGVMDDIFSLQNNIAQSVVRAIIPQTEAGAFNNLTNVGTENVRAYEAFLIGQYERTQQSRDSIDRAIEQFELAISYDPGFLRAYERLIDAYDLKGFYYGNRAEMLSLAEQALAQARENDPIESNPNWFWVEQLISTGERVPLHFGDAEKLYSLMIKNRSHPANQGYVSGGTYRYSLLLAKSGFLGSAIQLMESVENSDPLNLSVKLRLAEFYAAVYDFGSALEKYAELLAISPRYVQANLDMFLIYGRLERYSDAENIRDELAQVFSVDLTALLDTYLTYWNGEPEEAITKLDSLADSEEIPANYMGTTYLAFGEIEQAFSFFNLAADQDDPFVGELIVTQARLIPEDQWLELQKLELYETFMARFGYSERWKEELLERANALSEFTNLVVSERSN